MGNKKIYFASDFHLGVPTYQKSREREKLIVRWLDEKKEDAEAIYLVGDIFDFWFEYKHAIPKGYVRLLGKMAEIVDSGIPIIVFRGNHDMWMFDYLEKEVGVKIYTNPIEINYSGKTFFIGHGDGLGPGDSGYKMLKKLFQNKFCQWMFARIHPNFGIGLADYLSKSSRKQNKGKDDIFLGEENEWLVVYCNEILQSKNVDFFIFGHRHLPLDISLNDTSRYVNLGDWIKYFTYAEFDGENLILKEYLKEG